MKITTKGQVTIPQDIRERLGMLPQTEVDFVVRGDEVLIRKLDRGRRGRRVIDHLKGRGTVSMSTEDILRLTRGDCG